MAMKKTAEQERNWKSLIFCTEEELGFKQMQTK